MKKLKILMALILLILCRANAQQQIQDPSVQAYIDHPDYRIGEEIPDFGTLKIVNSVQPTLKLSDFKDQLLILDFWGLTCASCIEEMPQKDALQKQFGSRIKILPVASESKEALTAFWKTNRYLKNLTLASVAEDKVLRNHFRFMAYGLQVWIDKGKVIGLTGPEEVNADNIKQVLEGKIPDMPVRNDFYRFDAAKQALFKLAPKQTDTGSAFIRYAAVAGYREVMANDKIGGDGKVRDPKRKTVRVYIFNQSIYNAYFIQFLWAGRVLGLSRPDDNTKNHIVWEVTDKYKYIPKPGVSDWIKKHAICFESLNQDVSQTDKQLAETTIADLNRLLGLQVRWEKRKEKVLVLLRTTAEDKLKSKKTLLPDASGHLYDNYIEKGILHQFRDASLYIIMSKMNNEETNPYVYDETGYTGMVDMDLQFASWTDIAGIKKAIQPYGLDLKEEERLVDKFVFTETTPKPDQKDNKQ